MPLRAGSETRYPWEAHYPSGVDWRAEIPLRRLDAVLDEAVARFAARPALDFLGRKMRYGELGALVDRLARGFQDLGVGKGVRVALLLPNCPYFVSCFFAILKAGGTVVNLNPLEGARELAREIRESETAILVTLDLARLYGKVAEAPGLDRLVICSLAAALPFPKNLLFRLLKRRERAAIPDDGRHVRFERLAASDGCVAAPAIAPAEDLAVLLYTGGTTGPPKGVCLTHANVYANTVQSVRYLTPAVPGAERALAVIPFFHAFGMTAVMTTALMVGAELVLLARFDVDELLGTVARTRPTLFAAVPTIYAAIAEHPALERYDLSCLKVCSSGGDALPDAVREAFERRTGTRIAEGYGLTEAAPVVTFNPPAGRIKAGSIGPPLPATVVEIVALEDRRSPVAEGASGEICVSGPQVMAGYWRRPEATAEALADDRLHTGDVGYLDADGYLYLVDRLGDVIVTGGNKVFPRYVEAAIGEHPAVAEAAVAGVPDPRWGQVVHAFVVLAPGAALTEAELRAFLEDRLSAPEMPRAVAFRADLPKSVLGKVLKGELVGAVGRERGAPPA